MPLAPEVEIPLLTTMPLGPIHSRISSGCPAAQQCPSDKFAGRCGGSSLFVLLVEDVTVKVGGYLRYRPKFMAPTDIHTGFHMGFEEKSRTNWFWVI